MGKAGGLSWLIMRPKVRVFLSLAKTRSFTATSRLLGLSQSSVSRLVGELEDDLSVPLIDHGVRPVRLTPAGVRLEAFLLEETKSIDSYAKNLAGDDVGKPSLRLGVVESVARTLGSRVVRDLSGRCSSVTVLTGVATYLLRLLDESLVDTIICSDPFLNRNDLDRRFLLREPSVLILPEDLPLAERPTWGDMLRCGLPLVHYHGNNSGRKLEEKFFGRLGLSFPNKIEVDINALLLSFVAEGMGWGLTRPTTLVQHPDLLDGIRVARCPEPVPSRQLYVTTRKGEFGDIASAVAEAASRGFSEDVAPRIVEKAPWARDMLVAAKRPGSDAVPPDDYVF